MKRIATIAGSNSSKSINKELVHFVGGLMKDDTQVDNLDLIKYDVPIYNPDREKETGVPEKITELFNLLKMYDAFIIATPEHNGGLPAFFKNILDWLSRVDRDVFGDKPTLLLATSPGRFGAGKALSTLSGMLPHFGADVKSQYSLASFYDSFDMGNKVLKTELETGKIAAAIKVFVGE